MTTAGEHGLADLPGRRRSPGCASADWRGDPPTRNAMADMIGAATSADGVPWCRPAEHVRDRDRGLATGLDPVDDVVIAEVDGRLVAAAGVERVVATACRFTRSGARPSGRTGGAASAARFSPGRRRCAERARRSRTRATPVATRRSPKTGELGDRALLEAAGFETVRQFYLMRRDLDEPSRTLPCPTASRSGRSPEDQRPHDLRRRGRGLPRPLGPSRDTEHDFG